MVAWSVGQSSQSRSVFSPAFVAHVDPMIAEVPEAASDVFLREWQDLAQDAASVG
jgi:hypothetical protein